MSRAMLPRPSDLESGLGELKSRSKALDYGEVSQFRAKTQCVGLVCGDAQKFLR